MYRQLLPYDSPNRPIRAIMGDPMPKDLVYDMHFHTEIEILYVISGGLRVFSEAGEFTVHCGDALFVNSNIPHSTKTLAEGTHNMRLQFVDPSSFTGPLHYLSKFLRQADTPVYVFRKGLADSEDLVSLIKNAVETGKSNDISDDFQLAAIMYMVTALLYRKKLLASKDKITNSKMIEKITPILNHIDQSFDEDITLDTLSSLLNLNKQYLCRLFKKATGSTIIDYLNFVRTCKAEAFLKEDMNISDVAYKVGFSSPSYFNKIFKRYKLCTPLTYKHILQHTEREENE